MAKLFWVFIAIGLVFTNLVYAIYQFNETEELFLLEAHEHASSFLEGNGNPLLVGLTLIHNAAAKGAGTTLLLPTDNTYNLSPFLSILNIFGFLQCAWMEHYLATICIVDMDQEKTVGLLI